MYLRRLTDVLKKASLLRCFWGVFEMSLSMEICSRHLKGISCRLGLEDLRTKDDFNLTNFPIDRAIEWWMLSKGANYRGFRKAVSNNNYQIVLLINFISF